MSEAENIILFDGVCNLCSGVVQFILKRDKKRKFRYAALQNKYVENKFKEMNIIQPHSDSVILFRNDKVFIKSDAVIEISKILGFPWNVLVFCRIMPRKIRDSFYDFIARNRYQWFGKKEKCMIPPDDYKSLFLD